MAATVTSIKKIAITQTAYDLAMELYAAGANNKAIPVTPQMLERKLNALVNKNIVQRSGQTPGRYGKRGIVKIVVPRDALVPIPNRAPRTPTATRGRAAVAAPTVVNRPRLSISALEEFVREYRRVEKPLREERSQAVEQRLSALQASLGSAKGDDFRNTMAMANAVLREQDEIDRNVAVEVLASMDQGDVDSPTYVVYRAMGGGR